MSNSVPPDCYKEKDVDLMTLINSATFYIGVVVGMVNWKVVEVLYDDSSFSYFKSSSSSAP